MGSQSVGCYDGFCDISVAVVKYDTNGNQLWQSNPGQLGIGGSVQTGGITVGNNGQITILANLISGDHPESYLLFGYTSSGVLLWQVYPSACGECQAKGLTEDNTGAPIMTGQGEYIGPNYSYAFLSCQTYKVTTNGSWLWTNNYPMAEAPSSSGNAIAGDAANNVYVTGYSPGATSGNDIVTIKYDSNGNQIWLLRYNGPGNVDDQGNDIAVDSNGNVYVTGYETVPGGGTEMVTIKYSPITLQPGANGTILLQAEGAPGEIFEVQASTNLQTWQNLGIFSADTNGLLHFTDTNASNFNSRFYFTTPQ